MSSLITVIIPVYNVEKYLNQCIESICKQSYENLDIILINDGSIDNCGMLCDLFAEKDARIKVIHKKNGGLSDARNAGLQIAKGQYIVFVDSDDWINEHYIEYMYSVLQQHDSDIVACDYEIVNDGEKEKYVNPKCTGIEINSRKEALSELIQGRKYRAVAWNKLYKAELLKNEQFEFGKIHEDEYFTYRIIGKAEKLAYIDTPLYYYRQRAGSIMTTLSVKHIHVLDAYYNRLLYLKNNYTDLYKKDKVTFCYTCANYYLDIMSDRFNDKKQAKELILNYRKKIKFSFKEIREYSLKEKIFIIGSSCNLISIFTWMRYILLNR